ncbi:protein containing DUF1566 [Candidatus Magnetobacterium bavaricum]|uniref:Protein containing DUF1566 n=1 Tax=Candidatus Magnetobacterium bavaricum TaxID=29290 RepID=A0A0F3GUV2_9BACT|nr:protein containing DUF1566 [Candidatus Magnetobacterium bavaricum]
MMQSEAGVAGAVHGSPSRNKSHAGKSISPRERRGLLALVLITVIVVMCLAEAAYAKDYIIGVAIDLPKTGQTTCYDASGNAIACAGTGQDGELQSGVALPDLRFSERFTSGGEIFDELTGLIWAREGGTPTVDSCNGGAMTWQAALDYVACLNTTRGGGWWLPNINELASIINTGGQANVAAWLNSKGFTNVQLGNYWSSTTDASDKANAWCVNMSDGTVYYCDKSGYNNVLIVRSHGTNPN